MSPTIKSLVMDFFMAKVPNSHAPRCRIPKFRYAQGDISMKRFISPTGEYQEHGGIQKKSFYTFYEILKPPAEEGIYVIVAWARWDTYKDEAWNQRQPADYGHGFPNSEEGKLAFEVCQAPSPSEHNMDFIVYEDGSAELKINENVTLEFEAESFNFFEFVLPISDLKSI